MSEDIVVEGREASYLKNPSMSLLVRGRPMGMETSHKVIEAGPNRNKEFRLLNQKNLITKLIKSMSRIVFAKVGSMNLLCQEKSI